MSKYNCYLCTSDEGILLNIFGDGGKIFRENIETCLSVKIKQSDAPSTKICHKCAWELDCCGKFIRKYKSSRDIQELRASTKEANCILCHETGKKNRIFELRKGNALNKFQQKISKLFNEDFLKGKLENLFICLDCRYNVDVLFDLKNIYKTTLDKFRSILENGGKLSDLPKTRTRIVSRKTTQVPLAKLNGDLEYDSDTSTSSSMSSKRKRGIPRKNTVNHLTGQFRTCEECTTCVEHGIDMYRYHRTGMTVCRECWLTMDPEKMTHGKRKKLTNTQNSTKLCAVFLKDVLSNPSKYKNIYKMEKDEHGNTIFLITDDSSENDEKEKTRPKRLRGQSSLMGIETKKATKRLATGNNEAEPMKQIKGRAKSNEPEASFDSRRQTRNGIAVSETSTATTSTTRHTSVQSTSGLKSIIEECDPGTRRKIGKKFGRPVKSGKIVSSSDKSPTRLVNEDITVTRKITRTRSSSFTSQETISSSNRLRILPENTRRESKLPEIGTKRVRRTLPATLKNAKSDSELEKPYTCAVCRIGYKNKLIGMAHQLTHAKQPEVKLERVVIPEIVIEAVTDDLSKIDEPEQQSHDVSSTSDHKHEEPLGDISEITVVEDSAPQRVEISRDEEDLMVEKLSMQEVSHVAEISKDEEDSEGKKSRPEIVHLESDNEALEGEKTIRGNMEEMCQEKEDVKHEISKPEVMKINREKKDLQEEKTAMQVDESREKEENLEERSKPEAMEISRAEEETRPEVVQVSQNKEDLEGEKLKAEVTNIGGDKDVEEKKLRPEMTQVHTDRENAERVESTMGVAEINREKENSNNDDDDDDGDDNDNDEKSRPEVMQVCIEKETLEEEKLRPEVAEMQSQGKDSEIEPEQLPLSEVKSPKIDRKFDEKESNVINENEKTKEATGKTIENPVVQETQRTEECTIIENKLDDTIDENNDKIDENENKENDQVSKDSDEIENSTENSNKTQTPESSNVTETCEIKNGAEKSESACCKDMEKESGHIEFLKKMEFTKTSINEDATTVCTSTEPHVDEISNVKKEIESDGTNFNTTVAPNTQDNAEVFVDSTSQMEKNDEKYVKDDSFIVPTQVTKDGTNKSPERGTNETMEISNVTETDETRIVENTESLNVVTDVLKQVFDLASAEVKKRLDKAKSNDENCTTSVSETLENISREIEDSADMPSLELDDQSPINQS